ncbi:MAG: hydroxyacylglutathione hydrolase [Geminicoccaceae bacterium]|nr:hydroxyacylglutathione hydrolase [Geminicoccaceae bacterium]
MAALDVELLEALSDNYVCLVVDPATGTSGVVDPAEADLVLRALEERDRKLDWILNTHHHADHTAGNLEVKRATGAKIAGPAADAHRIEGLDVELVEGENFVFGSHDVRILETPGHTSGHIAFFFADAKVLFCGDTLFALGCGRLFEGTPAQMWHSLEKFASMPDETLVYCGHEYTLSNARFALTVDPDNKALGARAAEIEQARASGRPTIPTTLGLERRTNPFLRPHDPGIRRHLGMEDAGDADVFAEIRARKDRF